MRWINLSVAVVVIAASLAGTSAGSLGSRSVANERQERDQKEPKTDKDRLQGGWTARTVIENGTEAARPEDCRVVFKGDRFTIHAGAEMKGSFKIDPATNPKVIDLRMTDGPEKGQTVEGIYKLAAKELRICFAKPGTTDRPTDFVSKQGMERVLIVLKRD